MKVLNLYAGLGGNRKLWKDVEVTAVELDPETARFYKDHFPEDKVIIGDAHQYLLDHYQKFDFIWESTECQKNSKARFWGHSKKCPQFPNLTLYQHIIFLKHHFKGKFVSENVEPYYEPLLEPTIEIGRHLFWSNFRIIRMRNAINSDIHKGTTKDHQKTHGFNLSGYNLKNKRQKIRNCVHPKTGLHVLNCARGVIAQENVNQETIQFD